MSTIATETAALVIPLAGSLAYMMHKAIPRLGDALLEVLARVGSALLLGLFAYFAIRHWLADPARITLLLLVIAECFTVGLSLFTRAPVKRDWTPSAFVCSMGATYYFLAVQLGPGARLVPESVGAAFQISGICWQLVAKISLGRSFGILPADRGVVSCGAYRFVRHPMYLGYLVADIGFLLTNFGMQNILVYGFQFSLQGGRILREERILSSDESYRRYKEKVRYRVIPWMF